MSIMDVTILFIFVWLFFTKSRPATGFDRVSTGTLRGIAMLLIILHHIHIRINDGSLMLESAGYLATGLFFFISGYGNQLSLTKKEESFRWLINKFIKIYRTYLVGFVLYWFILKLLYKEIALTAFSTVKHLLIMSMPNQVTWFPKMILLSFAIHWVLNKYFRKHTASFFWIIDIIILGMMVYGKVRSFWWFSFLCYPTGVLFAEKKDMFRDKPLLKFFVFGLVCTITALTGVYREPARIIAAMTLSICCYYLTEIYHFESKQLEYVGNNSFEFYIFHVLCLQTFAMLIGVNALLYGTSVILGSIALVHIYLKIKNSI